MWKNRLTYLLVLAAAYLVSIEARALKANDSEFRMPTIHLGLVVSDVEKAVEFYTKAIGFREVDKVPVSRDVAGDMGLTDYQPLNYRVLVLSADKKATRLKVMEVPGVKTKPADNRFIHSQLGLSYITIYLSDMNATLARLKEAGVKPLAKGPVLLPGTEIYVMVVRDPDGNLIEMGGPKK
jgi:catechol 2,3-dioxygenase-like lactoylglutathione lyase family enzyme